MARKSPAITHLSPEAKRIYRRITGEYCDIIEDPAGHLILVAAMEAFDRMKQAQAAIAEHGLVFLDRYEQPRANPAAAAERDSRAAMLSALKQLNLDVEVVPHAGPGRPPGR